MGEPGAIRNGILDRATSLGFYLYAFLLAPPLARALKVGLAADEPLWIPGFLLLAAMALEPVGLVWKLRFLRRRNLEDSFEPQGSMLGIFSAVTIGHMILTLVVGMLMLDCWGAVGNGSGDDPGGWWGAAIIALFLKDFIALIASGGNAVSREAPGHWKERAADVFLLAFGCVAYTAWWETLLDLGDISGESLGMKLALLPLLGGVFLFFYLPLRLPFLLDECYLRPAAGRKARIWGELAIGAVLGFLPAFF